MDECECICEWTLWRMDSPVPYSQRVETEDREEAFGKWYLGAPWLRRDLDLSQLCESVRASSFLPRSRRVRCRNACHADLRLVSPFSQDPDRPEHRADYTTRGHSMNSLHPNRGHRGFHLHPGRKRTCHCEGQWPRYVRHTLCEALFLQSMFLCAPFEV